METQPKQPLTNEELLALSEKMLERAQNGYSRQAAGTENGTLSALIAIAGSLIVMARNSEERQAMMEEIHLPEIGGEQG
ncbi:MAG TPA: hypothetical protein VNG51_19335 [Ktedonobacteraceae bacterium]|nr:hypothetical protein [Ktedonobacteraceae bacterium]